MAVIGARPATGIGIFGRRARPHRRPVQRPRGRRAGGRRVARRVNVSGLMLTVLAAACLCFFYLSQSSHVAATGYEIDSLEAQISAVRQEQQQLVLAIGEARSPSLIEQRARTRLGLVPVPQDQIAFAPPQGASTK
jgi:hypothetical protein